MQQAMQALASGQHPQLMEQVGAKMGLSPDQLRQTAAAIASGQDAAIPGEVVERAMQLQWAMRAGAMPPMGASAAAAVPQGMPPGLLPPGGGAAHAPPGAAAGPQCGDGTCGHDHGGGLSLEGEEQQGCLELYRRAYGRHLDVVYPPTFVAGASLALASGALPFWAALLLAPLCFVLGVKFILIQGILRSSELSVSAAGSPQAVRKI